VLGAPLLVLLLSATGCGDALSSLQVVQRSSRPEYRMLLAPDFGRQGERLLLGVDFDAELAALLGEQSSYPTELAFGPGIQIEYFGPGSDTRLELAIRISPLAATGERQPTMNFSTASGPVTARGRFWVLPFLAE